MDALEYFRIAVALLYHEARHTRRLKATDMEDSASWGALRALPDDRWQAWQCVRPLLLQSRKANTAAAIEAVFHAYLRKNLAELEHVFRKARWPSNLGGPKWAGAAAAVRGLGVALDSGASTNIEKALSAVRDSKHNTGSLLEKYRQLESGR